MDQSPSSVLGDMVAPLVQSGSPYAMGMRILILVAVFILSIFLIEIIWNNVLIKKFPNARIQRLTFWDSLAMALFVSLLSGSGSAMMSIKS